MALKVRNLLPCRLPHELRPTKNAISSTWGDPCLGQHSLASYADVRSDRKTGLAQECRICVDRLLSMIKLNVNYPSPEARASYPTDSVVVDFLPETARRLTPTR